MGKILDARGEDALDVLADLLDPVTEIAQDEEISAMMRTGGTATVAQFAAAILRKHKSAVVQIMAIDDGKTPDEERKVLSAITIPARLMKLLSVPAIKEMLFGAAETSGSADGSFAASENGRG